MKKLKEIQKKYKAYKKTNQPLKRKKNEQLAIDIDIIPNLEIKIINNNITEKILSKKDLKIDYPLVPIIRKQRKGMYSFLEIEKQNTNISIIGKINSKNNDNIIYKKKIVKNANIFKNITKINSKNLDSNLSKINKKII